MRIVIVISALIVLLAFFFFAIISHPPTPALSMGKNELYYWIIIITGLAAILLAGMYGIGKVEIRQKAYDLTKPVIIASFIIGAFFLATSAYFYPTFPHSPAGDTNQSQIALYVLAAVSLGLAFVFSKKYNKAILPIKN